MRWISSLHVSRACRRANHRAIDGSRRVGIVMVCVAIVGAAGCSELSTDSTPAPSGSTVLTTTATTVSVPATLAPTTLLPTTLLPTTLLPTTLLPTTTVAPPPATAAPATTAVNVADLPACTNDPYVMVAQYADGYQQSAAIVQRRLIELGYSPGAVDGYLGPTTMTALEAWSNDIGLGTLPYNADGGSVDADILDLLKVRCEIPDSHCVLEINPTAPAVYSESAKVVQQRLAALGYQPGDADGYFGPASQRALLKWADDGDKRLVYWDGEEQAYSVTDKGFTELGASC